MKALAICWIFFSISILVSIIFYVFVSFFFCYILYLFFHFCYFLFFFTFNFGHWFFSCKEHYRGKDSNSNFQICSRNARSKKCGIRWNRSSRIQQMLNISIAIVMAWENSYLRLFAMICLLLILTVSQLELVFDEDFCWKFCWNLEAH